MSRPIALGAEERNNIVWLERQPGVTSVVVKGKKGAVRHRHAIGFATVLEADQRGVLVRTYPAKNIHRDLYVHAPAGADRDRWLQKITASNGLPLVAPKEPVALKHTVEKAAAFTAAVPAPVPVDRTAGQVFDVTPDLAAKWLERNTRNRPLRDVVVLRYASDMREGKWKLTGDAIAFDRDGAVVNGQHRLWAVLESGRTIPMLVVFNLDPDVVYVLDDHFKRKMTDIVHIARPGSTIQTKHTGTARQMMFSLGSTDRSQRLSRMSRQKHLEFMDRHMEAIEFAVRECLHSRSLRSLTNAQVLAVLARAWYTQDRERVKKFGDILITGMAADGLDDSMAIQFRNWMLSLDRTNVRAKASSIYAKAERALQGFLARESGRRSLYEAAAELFPLPEETAPKRGRQQ